MQRKRLLLNGQLVIFFQFDNGTQINFQPLNDCMAQLLFLLLSEGLRGII